MGVDETASSSPSDLRGPADETHWRPEDITDALVFLASDRSARVTGEHLSVVGGQR